MVHPRHRGASPGRLRLDRGHRGGRLPTERPDHARRQRLRKELLQVKGDLELALLILDPLVAFIGDNVNTHRDHHVRRVLAPLAALAESTRAAVLVVIHTNKGPSAEPHMRISGSIGFTGAARAVLLAGEDPQDENRRILAVVKSNLAEHPPPLAYRLVGVDLGGGITTSRVDWLGEAPEVDVRELLADNSIEERTGLEDVVEYLRELHLESVAMPKATIEADATAAGIHEKALQRARRRLGVRVWRDGFVGPWMWGPKVDTHFGQPHPVQNVQNGSDLRKQAPGGPILDTGAGFGDAPVSDALPDGDAALESDGHIETPPVKRLIAELMMDGLDRERVDRRLAKLDVPPPAGHSRWDIAAVIAAQEFRA